MKSYEDVLKERDEALAQKQRWFNEHQKVLDVKNQLILNLRSLEAELIRKNEALSEATRDLQHITRIARPHDTGNREYLATDWDYVLKLATRWLDKWIVR